MERKLGQIIAREQNTWLVRIYQGRDPETGTRKYLNQTIHGPFREAQRFLNLKLQQRDLNRTPRAAAITLNQFLDQWLATSAKPRLRARTFHDYESLLRLYIRPALGTHFIGTIGQMDMQGLYAQMFARGLSARTIEYTNAVLKSAFRQAVRWRMLGEDPCADVDLPRVKRKEMEALSVEECRRFLSVAEKSEWYALFALALTTGMRSSEYLALKWSDIDWQRGAVSVSRTIQVTGAGWAFDDTKPKFMSERPLIGKAVNELESMFKTSPSDLRILKAIEGELVHRSRARSARLLRRVREALSDPATQIPSGNDAV